MTRTVHGSPARAQTPSVSHGGKEHLAEVWGDVVDLGQLAAAIAIGAASSLGLYVAAGWLLASRVASPEVGRSYAMLAGLLGCVAGGAICARAFPPKRIMMEIAAGSFQGANTPYVSDDVPAGSSPVTLPIEVVHEMRALGLLEPEPDHGVAKGTGTATS